MKNNSLLIFIAILFTGLNSAAQGAKESDSLLDVSKFDFNYYHDDDNKTTKSVTIGNQTWAGENLDVSTFRNGDPIAEAGTDAEWLAAGKEKKPAWCYYKNDPANEKKLGKLYNWYAAIDARGLAPDGWHIPSEEEWNTLIYKLGGESTASKKMNSTGDWKNNGNGTNESGFNALPGSCRNHYATFYESGISGYWWSSTKFITGTAGYGFQIEYGIISKNIYDNDGLSVRCVKN